MCKWKRSGKRLVDCLALGKVGAGQLELEWGGTPDHTLSGRQLCWPSNHFKVEGGQKGSGAGLASPLSRVPTQSVCTLHHTLRNFRSSSSTETRWDDKASQPQPFFITCFTVSFWAARKMGTHRPLEYIDDALNSSRRSRTGKARKPVKFEIIWALEYLIN